MNTVKSKVRCRKCKSSQLLLVEVWVGHSITWEQTDGIFDRDDGGLEPGDAFKVEARCKECDHKWTVRGATQIDDIVID